MSRSGRLFSGALDLGRAMDEARRGGPEGTEGTGGENENLDGSPGGVGEKENVLLGG